MENEPLTQDEIMGISTAVESTYNTMPATSNLFTYFYCRSANLPIPDKEKFDNTGFVGLQQEGATRQRSGFVNPPTIEFSGDVDTGIFAVFARRMLGKADPVPADGDIILADEVFKHHFALLGNRTVAGYQLPSSTFIFSNGALDYEFGGNVGGQISVQQNGAEIPQYTANWMGSGLYKRVSDIVGFGTPTPPVEPDVDNVMDGAETEVEYTLPSGQKWLARLDAASPQRLKSISTTIVNNALDTSDKRAGAKRLDSTDPSKGWILSYLLHGVRTSQTEFRCGLPQTAGATIDELQAALNDLLVTNFKFRMNGDFLAATSNANYRNRVEVIYPTAYFRNIRRATDNGREFLDVSIFHTSSGTTTDPDFVKVDVINDVATAIV